MTDDLATDLRRAPVDSARVCAAGVDPRVLDQLYRAHVDDVIAYFARRCDSPHDVADLTAETFLAAMESAARYDPRLGRPVAWLLGIARHCLHRQFRRHSAERRLAARISGRRLLDSADIQRLEERIDAERRAHQLTGHLATLTAREREAVELVDLAGLTIPEAAAALRITSGVLRIRLHRAHTRIRKTEGA
jgi:RNA polymerase sigma-70 factor (ECF subfamily)